MMKGVSQNAVYSVAPFAGAWIEIRRFGSKNTFGRVAPFAGAWIEITNSESSSVHNIVAPFAGAWIEILETAAITIGEKSLPSRERGLKYCPNCGKFIVGMCRSLRGSVD